LETICIHRAGDLKDFLAFASNNGILRQIPAAQSSKTDLPFEDEVRSMLVERGWAIDTQIGCPGYPIDLAVRHPENKGFYVLGIECDGASYHSARTQETATAYARQCSEALGGG
jgi:hypothetical protein